MARPTGYKVTEKTKQKISSAQKGTNGFWFGKKRPQFSKEWRRKLSLAQIGNHKKLGKKISEAARRKISESHKGEKCYNWKGGINSINNTIRKSLEYKLWREAVFKRDNWTCQKCSTRGNKLHAHHIKSFSSFPDLRFVVSNGLTLCEKCHKLTDNYAGRKMSKDNIIGDGDIAKVLLKVNKTDKLFFASGVSNSTEIRQSEFDREINLLLIQDKNKHIVYFSSLCIFYLKSPYAEHKRNMEKLIKTNFSKYTIIRLGNIDFGINPNTIINFFRNQVAKGEKIKIINDYRYVINKDEFLHWINLIPSWNCEMNITGRRLTIKQIVDEYVR